MKKNIYRIITCLFVVTLIACGGGKQKKPSAKKNENFGQATGYAAIFDNDKALARDRAIDDAMKKLVTKVLGSTVSGHSLVKDFQLIESIVEAKSTGMVRDWKILDEKASGNTFIVTLEGEVYPAAVNDTIKATLENYGRPKFMVLIRETFDGKLNLPGFTVTELTMMQIMGNSGFEFVDAATTQMLLRKERRKMNQAMNGQVKGKVQDMLLDTIGAEVIVIGTATTKDQSKSLGNNWKSKSAILNIKAIDVYTGRILATVSSNAAGAHIENDTASKMAVQRVLSKAEVLGSVDEFDGQFKTGNFINQISRKFLEAATGRMIMMNISGLNFKDLTKFKNQLGHRIRGVKKVYPRGQSGKTAKIEVKFAGKTTDLAEELQAKADGLGFILQIKETYPNKIIITAQRK